MNKTNYNNLIARWFAEDISATEKEMLFTWLDANEANRRVFEEAKVLWNVSENYGEKLEVNTTQAWTKFEKHLEGGAIVLEKEAVQRPPSMSLAWKFLSRAAAILLLMTLGYWGYISTNSSAGNLIVFQTNDQEQKELELPDGSIVWLNENSSLSYQEDFKNRLVDLEGEALFDIVKKEGKKFEIQSGVAKTTVLGTSFNVRAYPVEDRIEVTVIRGKVALAESTEVKQIFLEAGDVGVWHEKEERLSKNESTNENATAWKTKQLIFHDQALGNIFKDLERYFDIKMITENKAILACSFTGDFKQKELDDILRYIQLATGIEFEKTGNKITIKGEGC